MFLFISKLTRRVPKNTTTIKTPRKNPNKAPKNLLPSSDNPAGSKNISVSGLR